MCSVVGLGAGLLRFVKNSLVDITGRLERSFFEGSRAGADRGSSRSVCGAAGAVSGRAAPEAGGPPAEAEDELELELFELELVLLELELEVLERGGEDPDFPLRETDEREEPRLEEDSCFSVVISTASAGGVGAFAV